MSNFPDRILPCWDWKGKKIVFIYLFYVAVAENRPRWCTKQPTGCVYLHDALRLPSLFRIPDPKQFISPPPPPPPTSPSPAITAMPLALMRPTLCKVKDCSSNSMIVLRSMFYSGPSTVPVCVSRKFRHYL